jgi:Rhodopirellula transposase DDE domain
MADETAGDPMSCLKWTHKSLRKLQSTLASSGFTVSPPTISRLLQAQDYSLQANRKRLAGRQVIERDQQFAYLIRWRKAYLQRGWPVISIDAKKTEHIGNFKNPGRTWRQEYRDVNAYDFPSLSAGKAIPYGIYDIGRNCGFVSVGTSHDTAAFAVATIRTWWRTVCHTIYSQHKHLLIQADSGGSNGRRRRHWKVALQEFATEFGLIITVTHFPTGASKWNPIEHRMFSLISANWAGEPLVDYHTLLNFVRDTTSATGFICQAQLDETNYPTQIQVSDQQMAQLSLRYHKRLSLWNYTIFPQL